jgi:squalene-hopene/tetraprenyl-beta-curcumene cyclase
LANVKSDGSISASLQATAYNTAVALNALAATKNPKYDAAIAAGRKFLLHHQADEDEGYKPDHPFYGGIGYGGGERPDMSNVYMVLEGLKATSTDPKDPVWQKALVFVSRSQNRSENKSVAANEGLCLPANEPAEYENGTGSYGGMTAAGLLNIRGDGQERRVQARTVDDRELRLSQQARQEAQPFYFYNSLRR